MPLRNHTLKNLTKLQCTEDMFQPVSFGKLRFASIGIGTYITTSPKRTQWVQCLKGCTIGYV